MANSNHGIARLDESTLENVIGGVSRDTGRREKFVSAFYCEACGKTVPLSKDVAVPSRPTISATTFTNWQYLTPTSLWWTSET